MQKTEPTATSTNKPDEVSILQLLLKVREYLVYLLRNAAFILLSAAIGGIYFGMKYSNVQPTFPGDISFLFVPKDVSKENKTTIKTYARLVNSKSVFEDVLFEQSTSSENSDLLINDYLSTYQQLKPIEIDAHIPPDFKFEHQNKEEFTKDEKYALKMLLEKITTPRSDFRDGFISISVEENLGLLHVHTSTPAEALTKKILDQVEKKFQVIFFDKIVQSEQGTFDDLKGVSDSLASNYETAYYQLNQKRNVYGNKLQDSTINANSRQMRLLHGEIIQLEVRADVLKLEYLETLKHYKSAHLNLKDKAPLIQVLDKTQLPIGSYRPSWKRGIAKGVLYGMSLIIFILLIRKIILDILGEQDIETTTKASYLSIISQTLKKTLPYLIAFVLLMTGLIAYLYRQDKSNKAQMSKELKTEIKDTQ